MKIEICNFCEIKSICYPSPSWIKHKCMCEICFESFTQENKPDDTEAKRIEEKKIELLPRKDVSR